MNNKSYNPLINFLAIELAILGHVVPIGGRVSGNTPRPCQYLSDDFLVARKHDKINSVSLLSVFIFFNNVKGKQ